MARVLMVRAYLYSNEDALTRAVLALGDELMRRKHSVDFLSLPPKQPERNARPGLVKARLGRPFEQLQFLASTAIHLLRNRHQYDVIVTCDTPLGLHGLVGLLSRTGRWRHIAWAMDLFYVQRCDLGSSSIVDRLLAAIEVRCLRLSSSVVVLGVCMRVRLQGLGVSSRRIAVIPVWAMGGSVDPIGHQNAETRDRLRMLYSGHAARRHPLQNLAKIVLASSDWRLRVVGTGDEIDDLRALLRSASGNVTVEEPVEPLEYMRMCRDADIHIVSLADPATGTCVPSKTYAAMSMAKPVLYIGSPHGQAATDVVDAEAGWVVSNDTDAIVDIMAKIEGERESFTDIGLSGFEWAQSHRTITAVGESWSAFIGF